MQPLFLHRISVVRVYLHIATTTEDPAGRDPYHSLSWYKSESPTGTIWLVDISNWGGWGPPETGGCMSPSFLQGAAAPQLQLWGRCVRSLDCLRKIGNTDFCVKSSNI